MNDFKAHKYGPTHEELLMGRKDTFVDGTDEGRAPLDLSRLRLPAELRDAVEDPATLHDDKAVVDLPTLRWILKTYTQNDDTLDLIYAALGLS